MFSLTISIILVLILCIVVIILESIRLSKTYVPNDSDDSDEEYEDYNCYMRRRKIAIVTLVFACVSFIGLTYMASDVLSITTRKLVRSYRGEMLLSSDVARYNTNIKRQCNVNKFDVCCKLVDKIYDNDSKLHKYAYECHDKENNKVDSGNIDEIDVVQEHLVAKSEIEDDKYRIKHLPKKTKYTVPRLSSVEAAVEKDDLSGVANIELYSDNADDIEDISTDMDEIPVPRGAKRKMPEISMSPSYTSRYTGGEDYDTGFRSD